MQLVDIRHENCASRVFVAAAATMATTIVALLQFGDVVVAQHNNVSLENTH